MKIFFAAAYQYDKAGLDRNKKIYEEIEKQGYTHLFDDSIKVMYEEFAEKIKDNKDAHKLHALTFIKKMQAADICFFEVSTHSMGIGFSIEKALELNKPTICLYSTESNPIFLSGVEDEKLVMKQYNEKNYKKVVKEALEVARERRDKRFNFFISPKLLDYLENTSNSEGITKSKFIRNLIVSKMRSQPAQEETA